LIKLASLCFRHRRMVLAGWCLALLAAILIGRIVPATYRADYQTPGAEATRTFDLLDKRFPDRKGDSIFIVFSAAGGIAEPTSRSTISALLASLATFPHVASVNSPFGSGGSLQMAPDGKTAFAVVNSTGPSRWPADRSHHFRFFHEPRQ
jgi:hypothetical protein